MAGKAGGFGFSDFLIRFLFIFTLIAATYNPTGYSFLDWAFNGDTTYLAVKVFIGLSLFLLHSYVLGIARRGLGRGGIGLAVIFFVTLIWALHSQQWLPESYSLFAMLVEAILSIVMAAGLSIVILWTKASGQVTATVEVAH